MKKKKKAYTCKQLPSGKWNTQVRYTAENGESKVKSITKDTQAECLKAAEDFRNGSLKANDIEHLTIGQAIKGYLEDHDSTFKDGTKWTYRTLSKRMQLFEKVKVTKVDRREMQKMVEYLTKTGLCNVTIQHTLQRLRAVLHYYGLKDLPIDKDLKFHQEPLNRKELPTFREVESLVRGTNIEVPCLLSLYVGGMRINEVLGAEYRDISEKNGEHYLHIHRGRVLVDGKEILQETPKTRESDRIVKIPEWLYKKVIGQDHFRDDDFIVPIGYKTLEDRFKVQIAKPLSEQGYTVTFHSLRKVYAVTNAKAGVMLNVLAKLGGWAAGSKALMKVYLQVSENDIREETAKFESYLAKTV